MSNWCLRNNGKSVILTPKVASTSLRIAVDDKYKSAHLKDNSNVAIWLRHPIERAASAYIHMKHRGDDLSSFLQREADDHLAPQVDYLNWRYAGGRGMHNKIPTGADSLIFEPQRVFFLEDAPQSYFDMCDWLGIDPGEKFPHVKRIRTRTVEYVFQRSKERDWGLEEVMEYFAKDMQVYEKLKEI